MFKGNMSKMLKQAQEMQKKMETVQEQLSDIIVNSESGGGMVKVKINGHLEILELKLDDDSLKEDKEIVEDLIICLLYTSPSPRDLSTSRMPSSA